MSINTKTCQRLLSLLISINSISVFAVPAGFEDLLEQRNEVIELQHNNTFMGYYQVVINHDTLTFLEPQLVFNDLKSVVQEAHHQAFQNKLSFEFPLVNERYCAIQPSQCDIKTNKVLPVYDQDSLSIKINIDADWLNQQSEAGYYRTADRHQRRAWLQSLNLSTQTGFDDTYQLGLRGNTTIGLANDTYVAFESSISNTHDETKSIIDAAYLRHDFDQRWYLKAGKLASYSANRSSEGGFNHQLLPSNTVNGLQFGTGMHFYQAPTADFGQQDIDIFSATGGKADFYLYGVLIHSQALNSGYNQIQRSDLPSGSFNVEVKIFEGTEFSRTEVYSLQSPLRVSDGRAQWLLKLGQTEQNDQAVVELATWLPLEDKNLWLSDISLASQMGRDHWLTEIGVSATDTFALTPEIISRWSLNGRFIAGQENGNQIQGWSLTNSINLDKLSLTTENRSINQDNCISSGLYTCMDQWRVNAGTNLWGNNIRVGYDVTERRYDQLQRPDTKISRRSISLGRNFRFSDLNSNLSATWSESQLRGKDNDSVFYMNLTLSLRNSDDSYYSSITYNNGDKAINAGYSRSGKNDEQLNLRLEQYDSGNVNLSGNVRKNFHELGSLSGVTYINRNEKKSKESAYLGYSVGFSLDEEGQFAMGRTGINDNSAAIIIESDSGEPVPHSVSGLGTETDSQPIFPRIMHPVYGYKQNTYRISESNI
ncbi:TcfC E-set like domain-containing protein, partial [Vibrio sp. V05_P4A8T149]